MYYDFDPREMAPDLDPAEMPLFDGENHPRAGLISNEKSYLIVRNIQVTRYFYGIASIEQPL